MEQIQKYREELILIEKSYNKLKKRFYKEVAEWFWTKGSYHELFPFFFEQNGHKKGKKLKEEPSNKMECYKYGVDANGRVIIAQRYYMVGVSKYYESFYDHHKNPEEIYIYNFDYEVTKSLLAEKREIISIEIFKYQASMVKEHILIAKQGWNNSLFEYGDQKLRKQILSGSSMGNITLTYIYNIQDELVAIKNGNAYWFKKLDRTFKKFSTMVEDRLLEWIEQTILKEEINESIFCIYLSYSYENHLPTGLFICTKEDKDKLMKVDTDGTELLDSKLWEDPTEFKYEFGISSGDDLKLFDQFNQEISMRDKPDDAVELIVRASKRLKKKILGLDLNLEPDFIVVASDWDGDDLKENYKRINGVKD